MELKEEGELRQIPGFWLEQSDSWYYRRWGIKGQRGGKNKFCFGWAEFQIPDVQVDGDTQQAEERTRLDI